MFENVVLIIQLIDLLKNVLNYKIICLLLYDPIDCEEYVSTMMSTNFQVLH